jgi:putative ABC transport system permease protein
VLKNYIKIAWKVMLRRKFFTFVSLFTISITLMILMAYTAIVEHLFQPMPPEVNNDRTLQIEYTELRGNGGRLCGSPPGMALLHRYTRNLPFVEKESFYSNTATINLYLNGQKVSFYLKRTDGAFWQILNFRFLEGGAFTEEDNQMARPVAIINEKVRHQIFGDGAAFGKMIEADGQRFRVVGVVTNIPVFRNTPFADIWVPIRAAKSTAYQEGLQGNFRGIYLARSSKDFPAIRAEFQSRLRNAEIPDPKQFQWWEAEMHTYMESVCFWLYPPPSLIGNRKVFIFVFFQSIILFMVLPAINLINLNISRILERSSEIGVRKAFGASSIQLIGQFIVENVLLTLIGGILGFSGSLFLIRSISGRGWFTYVVLQMNYHVFLYGLLLTLFFGLLSGIYPAWRMSRFHPVEALRGGR